MDPILWLKDVALPLWTSNGIDWKGGGFFEALDAEGQPCLVAKRAMVQARMLYSLRVARDMGWLDSPAADKMILHGADFLLKHYSLSSGAFRHSVNVDGSPATDKADLYTQAFAIFGLAQAFAVMKNPEYKRRALDVVEYLKRERQYPEKGYSELSDSGEFLYQSNPHMHLFEAFLAWLEFDDDPHWRRLAQEILDLCLTKFIDTQSGLLGEHFGPGWKPVKLGGRFVVEPGHQLEWAWLMNRYRQLTKATVQAPIESLVRSAEAFGICEDNGMVYDAIWSDLMPKLHTHRFWPQGERVKAHAAMGNLEASAQAMQALQKFFATPKPGLWFDRMLMDGSFNREPSRASSLYHIVGAISEFALYRGVRT